MIWLRAATVFEGMRIPILRAPLNGEGGSQERGEMQDRDIIRAGAVGSDMTRLINYTGHCSGEVADREP